MLVFFNEDESEGEFGFEYWVDATRKPNPNDPKP